MTGRFAAKIGFVALFALLPMLGCGGQHHAAVDFVSVLDKAESSNPQSELPLALVAGASTSSRAESTRKIIYTAQIELVVKDFANFEHNVLDVIRSHRGFAAERKIDRTQGQQRGGTWVIRVPVDQYDALLAGLDQLGFARERSETSDDVTEAYVDLEARIRNKRKLEERVIMMLDERPGKLTELMELERELSRVREEIERMEGRMRVLAEQTSLATVTVRVREQKIYEPPKSPTLGDRLAAAWSGSVGALGRIAFAALILVVAIAPWTVVAIPIGVITYWFRGKITGRKATTPSIPNLRSD